MKALLETRMMGGEPPDSFQVHLGRELTDSHVVADRMDRRLLLIVAAGVNLAVSAGMFVLVVSGALALWHIVVLALLGSLTWALDNPTRNAFVPDLVDREDLTNAIALNAVALEITVVVGPALGGILIPTLGMGGAYALITAICIVDVVVLLMMKKDVRQGPADAHESPLKSMVAYSTWAEESPPSAALPVHSAAFSLSMGTPRPN